MAASADSEHHSQHPHQLRKGVRAKVSAYQRQRLAEFQRLPIGQRFALLEQAIADCQTERQAARHRRYLSDLADSEQQNSGNDATPLDPR